MGAASLRGALATVPTFAWVTKIPTLFDLAAEFLVNWLANNGLIVMNLGAYVVNGKLDVNRLASDVESGIMIVDSGVTLTPEQMKEIDDAVIAAADKALPYGRKPTPTPVNNSDPYGPA